MARLHFTTVRASYDQPHTLAVQLTFLRRSSIGPALFTVTESKLGQRTSTIHIALTQGGPPLAVGYLTQSNFDAEHGISLPITYEIFPHRPPINSKKHLRDGTDPEWVLHQSAFGKFRKASQHLLMYISRKTHATVGLVDLWMHMPGQRFSQESLGYVVDSFPQLVETHDASDELQKELQRLRIDSHSQSGSETASKDGNTAKFWYPTVYARPCEYSVLPGAC